MIPRQRRGFFNFLCAFMPGASEMYMGFMKMGASLMLTFMLGIMAIGFLELSDAFVAIPAVLWFYGFFHARNLTTCHPEVFMRIRDDYFWNDFIDGRKINIRSESARKVIAWVLIILGVSTLWNIGKGSFVWLVETFAPGHVDMIYNILDSLPKMLVAVIIIFAGLTMISGKKKELFITDKTFDIASGRSSADFNNTSASTGFSKTSTPGFASSAPGFSNPSAPSFSSPYAPATPDFSTPAAPVAPDFTAAAQAAPDFASKKTENESSDNTVGEEKMDA